MGFQLDLFPHLCNDLAQATPGTTGQQDRGQVAQGCHLVAAPSNSSSYLQALGGSSQWPGVDLKLWAASASPSSPIFQDQTYSGWEWRGKGQSWTLPERQGLQNSSSKPLKRDGDEVAWMEAEVS